ncbi:hypothetical protein Nekkels1_39 [Cellulophaga phage Nekkels_1]|uniref:Uncharacterized protein n=1 Tax=Cellulophaga phage Nekkels_1 TaxID=2745692 RepID=A0A8E4UXG9_9CAUD|nr:hypothetical protein M1M31_gp39 [Cellulophaga phage Nekkels_1]QQO97040.1 hypothetical protein Nekkels1_39 [Cellulophaga phage Nekkels_1]QQO97133.1 hypothetical protein Nekkels2_39 [Cellulophaga phage Nekkels_2]
MNKELKEKLRLALLNEGLGEGLLAFLSVEKEEDIQGAVSNLKGLTTQQLSNEEILKLPIVSQYADKRVGDAKKSWDQKAPTNPAEPNPINPSQGLTAEAIAQLLSEAQKPLLEKLEGFEKNKARDAKLAEARNFLNKSKIPEAVRESRLKYFNPDAEVGIEDWVKEQELEHENYHQSLIDSGVLSAPVEPRSFNAQPTEAVVDGIVSRMK